MNPDQRPAGVPGVPGKTGIIRTVLVYSVFGCLWIFLSDRLVGLVFGEPAGATLVNTLKGLAFVAVTSLLLFFLLSRIRQQLLQETLARIEQSSTIDEERKLAVEFLRLVNESSSKAEMIRAAVTFFQQQSGCEAVGIRLKEEDDYPYYEARGFPSEFVLAENRLCARDTGGHPIRDALGDPVIECMCGNVICGRFDESKPFFTPRGSFWTNSTTELLSTTTDADRQTRTRNRCHGEGYESVALIGLRVGENRLGLLQLNDRRKGRFSAGIIAQWERLAGHLAVALAKFQAEEELQESERKYRSLVDHALVGVYRSDIAGSFLYVNEAMVNILGYDSADQLLAEPVLASYRKPGDRETFLERLKEKGMISGYELGVATKSGKDKTLVINAVLENNVISGMVMDITGQKRLETQLRQAQKMEAVGTLAGGIAHDFNNILSTIVGYGHLLKMQTKEDDPLRINVNQILEAADRATALTHSLLAFSRKQVISVRPVRLNDLIRKVELFLRRIIGEDINIRTLLGDDKTAVLADSGQIEQVLLNLATNARDAMPHGGTFTIETSSVELDETFVSRHGYGKPGAYALLTATDTGEGMDEETRRRIFEPFFTTKGLGKGTGLGLSIVFGIVKQHDGYIGVYSEPGTGTTFKIYLPLLLNGHGAMEAPAAVSAPAAGGTETILLAEDDAALRRLVKIVLEDAGYTLITAEDGREAVMKFIEHKDEVDLVLLDMIMPHMSGREAYEQIKGIRPDTKAIFSSGYTADKIYRHGMLEAGVELLLKPITPNDLLKKVREVLDRPGTGG